MLPVCMHLLRPCCVLCYAVSDSAMLVLGSYKCYMSAASRLSFVHVRALPMMAASAVPSAALCDLEPCCWAYCKMHQYSSGLSQAQQKRAGALACCSQFAKKAKWMA